MFNEIARKRKRGTDQNWKRTQVSVRSMVLRIRSMHVQHFVGAPPRIPGVNIYILHLHLPLSVLRANLFRDYSGAKVKINSGKPLLLTN